MTLINAARSRNHALKPPSAKPRMSTPGPHHTDAPCPRPFGSVFSIRPPASNYGGSFSNPCFKKKNIIINKIGASLQNQTPAPLGHMLLVVGPPNNQLAMATSLAHPSTVDFSKQKGHLHNRNSIQLNQAEGIPGLCRKPPLGRFHWEER